jgi:hypothetical protein
MRAFPDTATQEMLQFWMTACDTFLKWQRREVIEQEASRGTLAEHREALKWMLRLTRILHAQVADPEFPLRQFAPEIGGKLLQLEESWGLIQEPATDDEADLILQRFAHASGTGSAG